MKTDPTDKQFTPPAVMNYDPNVTCSGSMAKQTVKLIFGKWHYRTERTVKVGGNCTGLTVISFAVRQVYDSLEYTEYKGKEYAKITMTDADNTTDFESEDEEYGCEDWLSDMLISAEIIDITSDADDEEDNE